MAKRNKNHGKSRRNGNVYRPFRRRAKTGGLPGHIGEHQTNERSELSTATEVSRYSFDRLALDERHGLTVTDIQSGVDKPTSVTWINVIGLGDAAMIEAIGHRYGIHPLLLEDIVHTHQRPKVEIQDGRLALILRMVNPTAPLVSEQVTFLLCGSTIITFQEDAGDNFEPVRRRLRGKLGSIRNLGADYTFYALVDAVIDGFFPLMEDYGRTLEELEDAVGVGMNADVQQRVHSIRTEMSQLRKVAWSHREAMQRLVNDAEDFVTPATIPFLRDCLDHTGQVLDVAETFRDVAGDLRDLYFTTIAQRTNDVMKLLTIISTIFMPLTLIAGIYGMNFNYEASHLNMPETQWQFGYPYVLVLMLGITVAMLGYFYRKGWLFPES